MRDCLSRRSIRIVKGLADFIYKQLGTKHEN
jgi:hypothetical protein